MSEAAQDQGWRKEPREETGPVSAHVREMLNRRKGTTHRHVDDEPCPVPGCPSVTQPKSEAHEVF